MHMKHLHLLKIRSAVATLCVVVLLSACSNEIRTGDDEDGGVGGELTAVTLKVGPALNEQSLTSKGLSTDQENIVHNLYILAFQSDEVGPYRLKYYATGRSKNGGNGQFSFTLRRSVSGVADTKLLLIANQNPFSQVSTGMTYDEVQKVLTSGELLSAPAFADTGIPMFGFAGNSLNEPLEIKDNTILSANLLRAVARVDVGVGTYNEQSGDWEKGNVAFELTHVYVFKPQNKYTLIPLKDNLAYNTGGIPSVTAPSPTGTWGTGNFLYTGAVITNATSCKAEIYIPEVAFNGGAVYDNDHDKRTALVIGGKYNGKDNYYRIDFTTSSTNVEGTPLKDILRNHIYRYSITSVSQPGYDAPEKAYSGKPVELNFTASMTDWETGVTGSPNPDMLVRMNFNGINGTIMRGTITESGTSKEVTVKEKGTGFTTDDGKAKATLDYNNLLGEAADNTYNGTGNGGVYKNVQNAFDREGPYAKLIIAPDNAVDAVCWRSTALGMPKDQRVLDAKKACWDYRGQGQSDWRLPRLSELYLLWLNRVTINQSKGFTSLGDSNVTYWSASEGPNDQVYAVDAAGAISLNAKTMLFSVRCVREIK